MTAQHRHWRAVRRGRMNPATFEMRNRKAAKQFDRWFNGLVVAKDISENGVVWWSKVDNTGLIHKGRKP